MIYGDIDTSKKDFLLIQEIAKRGREIYKTAGHEVSIMVLAMDIETAHHHMPLDLDKFLTADPGNFSHDLGGIHQNINRETLELDNCFLPRCLK